jgi:hypothetical protein
MSTARETNEDKHRPASDNPSRPTSEPKEVLPLRDLAFCFRCGAPSSGEVCQVCGMHQCPTCGL